MTISPNNILDFGTRSHKFQDINYYISNDLRYMTVTEEYGVNLIEVCEEQDEDIVVIKE